MQLSPRRHFLPIFLFSWLTLWAQGEDLGGKPNEPLQAEEVHDEERESFLSEWVEDSDHTIVIKAILFLRDNLWTVWLNHGEVESLSAAPDVAETGPTPHLVKVGSFEIEILSVKPKAVTLRYDDETFTLGVGKQLDLNTRLISSWSSSLE